MARCGCETGTHLKAGCGIIIEGTGEPDDPYVISIDPCALAGTGLKVEDGCTLAVKDPSSGGSSDPASISDLAQRAPCGVVGAYLGGYLYKPQSTRASITHAVRRGYDLIHLPVRFLGDGTPVITPDAMLGRQNGNHPKEPVQTQTPARWGGLRNDAGTPEGPTTGWFGYTEPTEQGLVTLAEALELINNRIPAALELMWPITPNKEGHPVWTKGQEVPPQRVDAFLRQFQQITQPHLGNVIVTTQYPVIPGATPGQTRDVLGEIGAPHTGPALYTPQDADRNPPGGIAPGQSQEQQKR